MPPRHRATDDGTHKWVEGHNAVLKEQTFHVQALLPQDKAGRRHNDAIDGVGAELRTQHLEAYGKQNAVDDEVKHTDRQRYTAGNVQHRRDTTDATAHNLGGQHKRRPRKGVGQNAESDDYIREYQL